MGILEKLLGPNIQALQRSGDVEALLELADHDRAKVRHRAVAALTGLDDPRVLKGIARLIGHGDTEVAELARTHVRAAGDEAFQFWPGCSTTSSR